MNIKGFQFSAVEAAIKKPGRLDLALIFSQTPAQVAAVFTTNKVQAAPVLISKARAKNGSSRALLACNRRHSSSAKRCHAPSLTAATMAGVTPLTLDSAAGAADRALRGESKCSSRRRKVTLPTPGTALRPIQ